MSLVHTTAGLAERELQSRRYIHLDHGVISAVVGVLEWAAISAVGLVSGLPSQFLYRNNVTDLNVALGVGVTAAFLYVLLSAKLGLYQIPYLLAPSRSLLKVALAWGCTIALILLILFMLKVTAAFSRDSISMFSVLALGCLIAGRLAINGLARKMIADKVIAGQPAVIIGEASELSQWSAAELMINFGVVETARVVLSPSENALSDRSVRTAIERAVELSKNTKAEEFVVAIRWAQSSLLEAVQECLRSSPLRVRLLPDEFMRAVLDQQRSVSCSNLIQSIELQRPPMRALEQLIKRTLDLVLVIAGLVAIAPLLVFVAVAIKCDSAGPIIFKQRRNGFNGQQFTIYKFRTMFVTEDGPDIVQARRNDSRVTRVGSILRRTSIDELPQLFNVLLGDMSLIGPRPHALAHDDKFKPAIANYAWRHHVKPGLTGWAQIHGHRGETRGVAAMYKRVEFDIWYINNWSLGLDFLILVRTFWALFKNEAY